MRIHSLAILGVESHVRLLRNNAAILLCERHPAFTDARNHFQLKNLKK
jgi:hypothetical protein